MDAETEKLVEDLVEMLVREAETRSSSPTPPSGLLLPRPTGPRPQAEPLEVWARRHGLG